MSFKLLELLALTLGKLDKSTPQWELVQVANSAYHNQVKDYVLPKHVKNRFFILLNEYLSTAHASLYLHY